MRPMKSLDKLDDLILSKRDKVNLKKHLLSISEDLANIKT